MKMVLKTVSAFVCPLPVQVVEFHSSYGEGHPLEERLAWGLIQNTGICDGNPFFQSIYSSSYPFYLKLMQTDN